MPIDCDKLDCCGPESYGYEIENGSPNPPPIGTAALTLTVDPAGYGVANGAGVFTQDTFATISAVANPGYVFDSWSGDYVGTDNPAQVYMDANKTVQANFVLETYNLQIIVNPDGAGYTTGQGNYSNGDTAILVASAGANFEFSDWSGSLVSTNSPENLLMDEDKLVYANFFRPAVELSTSVYPEGGGTVVGGGIYAKGDVASLSAIAANNFAFVGWAGDVISTDNPVDVLMDSSKFAEAIFQECPCYTLTLDYLRTANPTSNLLIKEVLGYSDPGVDYSIYLRKACRRWVCACINDQGGIEFSKQIGGPTVTGIDLTTYIWTQIAQPTAPGTYIYQFDFYAWRAKKKNPKPRPFFSTDTNFKLYQQTYAGINT